jgi:protein-tyrosine kinase
MEDEMKDSVFSDDLTSYESSDYLTAAFLNDEPAQDAYTRTPGLCHGIRPRQYKAKPKVAPPKVAPKVKPCPIAPATQSSAAPVENAAFVATPSLSMSKAPIEAASVEEARTAAPETTPIVPRVEAPTVLRGWEDLHKVDAGARKGAGKGIPVVDLARNNTSHRAFDLLRTRLRQTTQENNWVNIGVTAPTTHCGTTFTAVNLALSLSRVAGSRTVLMDMNLRDPSVMDAFDMAAPGEMQDYLFGDVEMTDHMMRISDTLALGLNAAPDENAAETLQNPKTHATLNAMRQALTPELVIYDLPPMLVSDDVSAFLPQLDGVLLVSDGTQTTAAQLLECERMLDGQVPLLGVVLNRARASSIPRYS